MPLPSSFMSQRLKMLIVAVFRVQFGCRGRYVIVTGVYRIGSSWLVMDG